MKNKLILGGVLVGVTFFVIGGALVLNYYFGSNQIETKNYSVDNYREPKIFTLEEKGFNYILGEGDKTIIIRESDGKIVELENSERTEPRIVSVGGNREIVSFKPADSKLYNGPFTNYLVDFDTETFNKFETFGRLIDFSEQGQKAVFLESECDKNLEKSKISDKCNDDNKSLVLLDFSNNKLGSFPFMDFVSEGNSGYLSFSRISFSPDGKKLAVNLSYEDLDGIENIKKVFWQLLIFDVSSQERPFVFEVVNEQMTESVDSIYWLDNKNILYF